jgi:hypothetical protein
MTAQISLLTAADNPKLNCTPPANNTSNGRAQVSIEFTNAVPAAVLSTALRR